MVAEGIVTEAEIAPAELKRQLDAGEPVRLVDVREPFENQAARIANSELIPMRSVPQALASLLTETRPVVLYCHHGIRSLQVVEWLRGQGVRDCRSLAGGIDRWSLEIDPAVPRYH
jgi:rhodanese-related sulfurtransferase